MRAKNAAGTKVNNICLFQDDTDVHNKVKLLAEELGFPRVKKVLSLYFQNNIRLKCDVNNLYLGRRISAKTAESWREARFSSRYLGTLITVLAGAGLKEAAISDVVEMVFPTKNDTEVKYLSDTLISEHQFEITHPEGTIVDSSLLKSILKNKVDKPSLIEITGKIRYEQLVDDLGALNDKVIEFCKETNLSLNQTPSSTYYHRISSTSNDYTELSNVFEIITGHKVTDTMPTQKIYENQLPSVSIIIPAFNLGESLFKTLKSIDRQTPQGIRYEVIIVDDGSTVPVAKDLENIKMRLSFAPVIIRKEQNSGISQTRNIGAAVSSNDILVFIDGDIVLTPNYLYEHIIRHRLLNKAVIVSFKENVEPKDPRVSYESISKGVPTPNYRSDLRITKYIDKDTMGYYANNYLAEGDIFSILTETNYFKTLGYGRRIGTFDLPSMVIGHNFSMPRNLFHSIGGFDNNLIGYGLEDSLIGIKAIAAGAFVVPCLASGVYHINHKTRRGNMGQLRKEFEINSKLIADFLSQPEQ